jgi:hypothetical protein
MLSIWIENAKINLKDQKNVIFINSDLPTVELPEPVDVIFSNAVNILEERSLQTIL